MKKTIRTLIDQSCGIHNCCKLEQMEWARQAGMSLNDCYRKLSQLVEGKEISIVDGMVYKLEKFKGE